MRENTASQIMDVAERIVQAQGYNAFSYADISARVGIRKASIHYHFPSKHDLGKELIIRYRQLFGERLKQIELETNDPKQQLLSYAQLYQAGLMDDRLCLCNMLAADYVTLPESMQQELQGFFVERQDWLIGVLQRGSIAGVLRCQAPIDIEAKLLISGLQGAQLMSRVLEDGPIQFETIVQRLLSGFIVQTDPTEPAQADVTVSPSKEINTEAISSEVLQPAPCPAEVPILHTLHSTIN